ncbi:MAG: RNA polymerase sigma factor [Chitinispirillaceae bacterium]|nr:RNA polymerase sigma factor [Chitinispirillaceae bacterium]
METKTDDTELIRLCQQDKKKHFSALVERYYEFVINFCFRFFGEMETAKDAAQDIFIKVYLAIESQKRESCPFFHWLCRVTSNYCRDIYRKKQNRQKAESEKTVVEWFEEQLVANTQTWLTEETKSAIEELNSMLCGLDKDERLVIIHSFYSAISSHEIAIIMGLPEYTVRRKKKKALEKLKVEYNQRKLVEYAAR